MRKNARPVLLLATFIILTLPVPAFAETPQLVSGGSKLLQDVCTWLVGLIPAGCAVKIGYHAFMKQLEGSDGPSVSMHNKQMRDALIAGAIGVSVVGLVKVILAYFS